MEQSTGIKELYDVNIRLTSPMEILGKKYDINESILSFETAEIAQIEEEKTIQSAKGGFHNPALINWEIDKEMKFGITHGVLSPLSWSLLSNSKIKESEAKSVSYRETLHCICDQNYSYVDLKYCPNATERLGAQPNPNFEPLPMGRRPELLLKPLPPSKIRWIFCYNGETGEKISKFQIFQNRIFFEKDYKVIVVDYTFYYEDKVKVIEVGNRLFKGFLKLDGKMSIKDQKTGIVTTGILELPKIKLSSSLSIRLGKNVASSAVSDFFFVGYPDEDRRREDQQIANITFLNHELTGDYI